MPHKITILDPSPQACKTKSDIAKLGKKIQVLEGEISQVQERMESLLTGKERLVTEIELRRAFIAPIRRLHPEIIQEIFRRCLPTAHSAVMCHLEAPMLLGQVCRYWRQLALEAPDLWTSIHIVIPSQGSSRLGPPLKEISAWLERSGALPLTISLSSTYPLITPTDSIDPFHAQYIDTISAFKSRWQTIWVYIPVSNWPNYFFGTISANDVPLLEKIHIQSPRVLDSSPPINGHTFDFSNLTREDSILHAPRLHSISILPCGSELLQLSLNWHAVTELNLSWNTFHYHEVIKALTLCPNIETCIISSVQPKTLDISEVELVLPRLISLALIDESDVESDLSRLLRGLRAPSLRHLSYERRPHWPPPGMHSYQINDTIDALGTFLGKLLNPLEELALVTDSLLQGDVMRILSLVPGVKRLTLEGYGRPVDDDRMTSYTAVHQPTFLFRTSVLRKLTPGSHLNRLSTQHATITDWADFLRNFGPFDEDEDDDDDDVDDEAFDGTLPQNQSGIESLGPLCPQLEVVHFLGCTFSDIAMLNFLKSRTLHQKKYNVARLKKASIAFVVGRDQAAGTAEEIEMLERETSLRLRILRQKRWKLLPGPKRHDHSPYDGVDHVPFWYGLASGHRPW